ncbi:MAG: hypothetical protein H8E59_06015 [Actinobacteria bacterium]|nr:hypothetical protein [Actinomycetota bacterium]
MNRRRLLAATGPFLLFLGLWVALLPFSRPLPGGAHFDLEATPRIGCRSPVIGAFTEDRPTGSVYTIPRPMEGDPMVEVEVPCEGRARFRLALGMVLLAGGIVVRRRATPT